MCYDLYVLLLCTVAIPRCSVFLLLDLSLPCLYGDWGVARGEILGSSPSFCSVHPTLSPHMGFLSLWHT